MLSLRRITSERFIPPFTETAPVSLIVVHTVAVLIFLMSSFLKAVHHRCQLAQNIRNITTITDCSVNIGCRNLCVVTFKILKSLRQRGLEAGKSIINVLRYATAGIRKSIRCCIIKLNFFIGHIS